MEVIQFAEDLKEVQSLNSNNSSFCMGQLTTGIETDPNSEVQVEFNDQTANFATQDEIINQVSEKVRDTVHQLETAPITNQLKEKFLNMDGFEVIILLFQIAPAHSESLIFMLLKLINALSDNNRGIIELVLING